MIRTLAPPPPSPEMAQSAAYRALPAAAKALLLLIEAEIASQRGMLATIDTDDARAATGMSRPALVAALDELETRGFIFANMSGRLCTVAPSSRWRT
jgi:hypothetical protein